MKPLYEKKVEDWARRALCSKLGISAKGLNKETQWHDIVRRVVNLKDTCERADIDWSIRKPACDCEVYQSCAKCR